MTNLIKTTASAALVALIAAVPMASFAATGLNPAFSEVPRDIVNGQTEEANINEEKETETPVSYATSPRVGTPEPAEVNFPGYGAVEESVSGRR